MFDKLPQQPFVLFGPAHLITSLVFLVVFLGMTYLCRYDGFKSFYKKFLLTGLIILDIGFRLWAGFYQKADYVSAFSVHISSASVWLSVYLLVNFHQKAFDVLFYWGLIIVPQAIITPGIPRYGFPHMRFFHILLIHYMVLFTVVYFIKVEKKSLSKKHLVRVLITTHIYGAIIFLINRLFDTNYMFIGRKTNLPSLLQYLGDWPYYIVWLDVILISLFVIANQVVKKIERKKNGLI